MAPKSRLHHLNAGCQMVALRSQLRGKTGGGAAGKALKWGKKVGRIGYRAAKKAEKSAKSGFIGIYGGTRKDQFWLLFTIDDI